jgi:peptidoglycan/LPS O-acetylase OafA/YrhL
MGKQQRLLTLDAMRGVAALLVVLFHLPAATSYKPGSGFLAVDFFFLLSGFVLARSYDARLAKDMKFWQFARMRMIRLYPLFALGLVLALAERIWQVSQARIDSLAPHEILFGLMSEVFMLPSLVTNITFPLNSPSWSLFFEIVVNLVYAKFLFKLRRRGFVATVSVSGTALALTAVLHGKLNAGYTWDAIHIGALRTLFSFSVGILLARLYRGDARNSWFSVLPVLALATAMSYLPTRSHVFYDLFVIVVLGPAIVWAGACVQPPTILTRVSELLGDLSYPVYATHLPIILMFAFAADMAGIGQRIWLAPCLAFVVMFAWAALRYIDIPTRRRLRHTFPDGEREARDSRADLTDAGSASLHLPSRP